MYKRQDEINQAIVAAKESNKPTMIVCKTSIGYGAGSKQDSESSHGAPLGEEVLAELRKNLDWEYKPFEIPESVYADWDFKEKGKILKKIGKQFVQIMQKMTQKRQPFLKD